MLTTLCSQRQFGQVDGVVDYRAVIGLMTLAPVASGSQDIRSDYGIVASLGLQHMHRFSAR